MQIQNFGTNHVKKKNPEDLLFNLMNGCRGKQVPCNSPVQYEM